jgi:O-antigen ligase
MDVLSIKAIAVGRQNLRFAILAAIFFLFLLLLMLNDYHLKLLVLVGFAAGTYIAVFFPLATTAILLVIAVLPTIFAMTPIFNEGYSQIPGGLNAEDIVLLCMGGAIILRLLRQKTEHQRLGISRYMLLFTFWLVFEVLRNIGTYGISAPGEFRYRYLILVLPLYVALFFDRHHVRRSLLKVLILTSVIMPLVCVPFIGMLKGWAFGPDSRFLPASLSLGLVYGFLAIVVARRYQLIKMRASLVWWVAILILFMVIIDSHRSVWATGLVSLLVLFLIGEVTPTRTIRLIIPIAAVIVIVIFMVSDIGMNPSEYIASRGTAFVAPELDQTGGWRIAIWAAAFDKILASPLAGEGFGGYWAFWLPGSNEVVTVSPHSLYIQSLMKIGAIGLGLYFIIVFKLGKSLLKSVRRPAAERRGEYALVVLAFVILAAAHVFYIPYSLEYYTWLFVGLGAAALRNLDKPVSGGELQTIR